MYHNNIKLEELYLIFNSKLYKIFLKKGIVIFQMNNGEILIKKIMQNQQLSSDELKRGVTEEQLLWKNLIENIFIYSPKLSSQSTPRRNINGIILHSRHLPLDFLRMLRVYLCHC